MKINAIQNYSYSRLGFRSSENLGKEYHDTINQAFEKAKEEVLNPKQEKEVKKVDTTKPNLGLGKEWHDAINKAFADAKDEVLGKNPERKFHRVKRLRQVRLG